MASLDSLRLSILPISRSRDDTLAADMELHHIGQNTVQKSLSRLSSRRKHPDSNTRVSGEQSGDVPNDLPPPSTAVQVLQSHVPTSGGSLLPSLLSYYLDSMTPYGCHECPRKTRTMLTFLRHMAYGSDEPPLKDVDDTDLYQALIPYVRLSMFSFAQFGISYV